MEKHKQLQQEITQLKAELARKEREVTELRKQLNTSKINLDEQVKQSKENLEDLTRAREELGEL